MNKDLISRQDAIKEVSKYVHSVDMIIGNGTLSIAGCIDTAEEILEGLPSMEPEPKWIPCSERLPENEYVLISKKQTMISGDKWSVAIAIRMADPRSGKIQWRDSGFGVIHDDKVLAWMPIPIPYCGGYGE